MQEAELVLRDGQLVRINELHQSRTYEGLLCGLPNKLINGSVLSSYLEQAQALWHGAKPYLIEPKITRRTYEGIGKKRRVGNFLPAIACIALLDTLNPRHMLGVVWFQDHLALPIAQDIVARMADIDWKALSAEVNR